MRPCDCKSIDDVRKLDHNGVRHNEESIALTPNYLTIKLGPCSFKISQNRFKSFAEWYLMEQDETGSVGQAMDGGF